MSKGTIGIIAFLVVVTSTLPYVWSIAKRRHDTSVTGWVLGIITGLSLLITYDGTGADDNIGIAILEVAEPLLIAAVAIWRRNKWERPEVTDIVCAVVCVLSLAIYLGAYRDASSAKIAFGAILLADLASTWPIVAFAWKHPESEQPIPWIWGHVGVWISFWSINNYSFDQVILPIYQLVVGLGMIIPTVVYRVRNRIPIRDWMN